MYVYCHVCKESVAGDLKVLQVVPIHGYHGDYVCERYDTHTYKLQFIATNSIIDNTGRITLFQAGNHQIQ